MSTLIYSFLASLDGYIADSDGRFEWAMPDEEVHGFINEQQRGVRTFLYGRTMYEMMTVWENDPALAADSPVSAEFAGIWRAADKIVFSRSLEAVSTTRTRIERRFDADLVRTLKATSTGDITVAGADLAASAWSAGLVDECQVYVAPMLVGSGRRMFPADPRR